MADRQRRLDRYRHPPIRTKHRIRELDSAFPAGVTAPVELSGTYQGAELDDIIRTFTASRPGATPAQLSFAITTSPIWRDAIKIAEAKRAQHAAPVFMYQLAYPSPTLVPGTDFPIGSPHASDINLKFANTDKNPDYILNKDQSPERLATARHMSELWAGFAHTGRPAATGVPRWPAYTLTDRATMWLDARCRIVNDPARTKDCSGRTMPVLGVQRRRSLGLLRSPGTGGT